MIDCISVENMRLSDAHTIANLVPSLELMYRAAWGVFEAVEWRGSAAIVVGGGNNGGDGFALACILREHGLDCVVYTVGSRLSPDSAHYAGQARTAGVAIQPFSPGCLEGHAIAVDCLLGTGFRGPLREDFRAAIEAINASGAWVVSVDINSGLDGDTGAAELAVRSDLTVTIGFVKSGLVTENAGHYIRRLVCVDIGIVLLREEEKLCTAEELEESLEGAPCRPAPPWLDMTVRKAF